MKSITAAVLREPHGKFSLESATLDDLRDGELLVRLEACGICHTDEKFRGVVPLPAVLGHEGAGIVEETGPGVNTIKPGDRIILSYPWCGTCPYCISGEPYNCEYISTLKFGGSRIDKSKTIFIGGEPVTSAFFQQSSFATFAIAQERSVIQAAPDLPAEMLAAIPCSIQTGAGAIINSFAVKKGESLIIFGAGAVGLSAVMAAKMVGAGPIICVDKLQMRLDLAAELGADRVLNIDAGDIPRMVREIKPRGIQYALETSTTVKALEDSLECIGQGGRIGIVSYPYGGEKFPFTTKNLLLRLASIQGIIQGHSVPRKFIPKLIDWQQQGIFPYHKLITVYPFSDINDAFRDAAAGDVVKPVLMMN
jgi:aryl-alcohol dehydrogenase